jgi:hypothetical protein
MAINPAIMRPSQLATLFVSPPLAPFKRVTDVNVVLDLMIHDIVADYLVVRSFRWMQ